MMNARANSRITEIIEIIEIIAKEISTIGELESKIGFCKNSQDFLFSIFSGNDFRGNITRGGNDRRVDDRRDNRDRRDPPPRREAHRDEPKEPRRERNVKDLEDRMPKFLAPAGPVSLTFSPMAFSAH